MNQANLLTYIKKAYQLDDLNLSQILNVTIQRLSKLYKKQASLTIDEVDLLCDHFSLSPISFSEGIIKTHTISQETITNRFNIFKIPEHYRNSPNSSGFLRQIYIESFKRALGEKGWEEFCQAEQVDPLYFTEWSNPIHPNFNLKIMREMARKNKLDDAMMGSIATDYVYSTIGNISKLDLPTRMNAANTWVNLLNTIEKCHEWEVLDCTSKDIEFSFTPFDFMDLNLYKNDQFLKNAKERYIKSFASQLIDMPMTIKQSFVSGASKTILSTKV